MANSAETSPVLKLAVVGGGQRCLTIMNLLESRKLTNLRAKIIGVSDINPRAVGYLEARRRGIFTTTNHRDLLGLADLDLIIELTGKQELLRDLAKRKPDSVRLIDYTASSLFHDLVNVGRELAEKEEEISLERTFGASLISAASEGMVLLDPKYRIERINRAACKWADTTPAKARGRLCYEVLRNSLTPCQGPATPCPVAQTLSSGKSAHIVHEFSDLSGNTFLCDVSTYPLINNRGQVVRVLEVFRDITRELSSRVELHTMAVKDDLARLVQEDKLLSLGKLVASVAHEINNPIASIINFNQLILSCLKQGSPKPEDLVEWEEWLELTLAEAKRSSQIVANLLSFARGQSLESRRVEIKEVLERILRVTRHRMEISKVEVECRVPDKSLTAWGDAVQLQQCFANLIFNALEAMPQGGRLIIDGGRHEGNELWIEVSDTGPGIPPEVLPKIFDPFFTTKGQGQGVGLGLSMVYGIIKEHRGHIEVSSPPEHGACFRITLPGAGAAADREGAE